MRDKVIDILDETLGAGYDGTVLGIGEAADKIMNLFEGERPLLEVPSHGKSIWCLHCGEEFGVG